MWWFSRFNDRFISWCTLLYILYISLYIYCIFLYIYIIYFFSLESFMFILVSYRDSLDSTTLQTNFSIQQFTAIFSSIQQYSAVFRSIPQYSAVFSSIPQYSAVFRSIPVTFEELSWLLRDWKDLCGFEKTCAEWSWLLGRNWADFSQVCSMSQLKLSLLLTNWAAFWGSELLLRKWAPCKELNWLLRNSCYCTM